MDSLPPMDDPFVPKPKAPPPLLMRPGCVTGYIINFAVLGGAILLILMAGSANPRAQADIKTVGFAMALIVIVGTFAYLRGLWSMRKWARIVAIVLHSLIALGLLGLIGFNFIMTPLRSSFVATLSGAVICFVIAVYVVYWFIANGKKFN